MVKRHIVAILLVVFSFGHVVLANPDNVSEPGKYKGFSNQTYDGWSRKSLYITARDGTRLAIDIIQPTRKGKIHSKPLPVIWEHRRYHRASIDENGNILSQLDRQDHPLSKVILYGYVIAIADVRGSGASFGTRVDPHPSIESLDAYDITEWLAKQKWCDGNVGMYGISYSGTAQLMAASSAPPHLKAIFPEMAMFDLYDLCYPGGIYRYTLLNNWSNQVHNLDLFKSRKAAPVDSDIDQKSLMLALSQHRNNSDVNNAKNAPYRSSNQYDENNFYSKHSVSSYLDQISNSKVAIYFRAGWLDMYSRDMLLMFKNLENPKKIAIGPWNHYQSQGLDRATELLRWYDYWLKGIPNGIMDEPPVMFGVNGLPINKAIRYCHSWPPAEIEQTKYYLSNGPCNSIKSINCGQLALKPPLNGEDKYTVNPTCTTGKITRWTGGGPPEYPEMTRKDQKGLTYTTPVLSRQVEIIGHPIVHLWLSSQADDVDLFVYLEEVEENGNSTYITEGCLRASNRKTIRPPYDNLGLPYLSGSEKDRTKLTNQPVELTFDLLPTANYFEAGHRIRITITCADSDNYLSQYNKNKPPEIKIIRNEKYPSHILLPIMPQNNF